MPEAAIDPDLGEKPCGRSRPRMSSVVGGADLKREGLDLVLARRSRRETETIDRNNNRQQGGTPEGET